MANLKYYDSGSEEWESLVIGKQGPTGPAGNDGALSPNAIINGAFEINQRNFTSSTVAGVYNFDRWQIFTSGGTATYTAETFAPGTGPLQEAKRYLRIATTGQSAAGDNSRIIQRIENVETFANQTVTLSFYAKATSGEPSVAAWVLQNFGSGGSATVNINGQKEQIGTEWERVTFTFAVPSITGKTIGAGSFLGIFIATSAGSNFNNDTNSLGTQTATIDIWGVQLEAGPTANVFRRNANSLQGELAACQRYFQVLGQNEIFGSTFSTTQAYFSANFPVTMRASASATLPATGSLNGFFVTGGKTSATAPAAWLLTSKSMSFTSTGYSGLTANDFAAWTGGNIQLNAEL